MSRNETQTDPQADAEHEAPPTRELSDAAKRALAEADARRKAQSGSLVVGKGEVGGREGPEPTRYGDWEKNGIISDF